MAKKTREVHSNARLRQRSSATLDRVAQLATSVAFTGKSFDSGKRGLPVSPNANHRVAKFSGRWPQRHSTDGPNRSRIQRVIENRISPSPRKNGRGSFPRRLRRRYSLRLPKQRARRCCAIRASSTASTKPLNHPHPPEIGT